ASPLWTGNREDPKRMALLILAAKWTQVDTRGNEPSRYRPHRNASAATTACQQTTAATVRANRWFQLLQVYTGPATSPPRNVPLNAARKTPRYPCQYMSRLGIRWTGSRFLHPNPAWATPKLIGAPSACQRSLWEHRS